MAPSRSLWDRNATISGAIFGSRSPSSACSTIRRSRRRRERRASRRIPTQAHSRSCCRISVGGLEARNRAGQWNPAAPVSQSFVINIGDMMQRWTNGRFVSTPYRVANRTGRGSHVSAVLRQSGLRRDDRASARRHHARRTGRRLPFRGRENRPGCGQSEALNADQSGDVVAVRQPRALGRVRFGQDRDQVPGASWQTKVHGRKWSSAKPSGALASGVYAIYRARQLD